MKQIEKGSKIVGLSTVTSNEEAFTKNTIGKLWDDFLSGSVKEKLADISSTSIFAVYSDYESDYQGKYKLTVGYAVSDTCKIPTDLATVTIPAGKYKSFKCKSSAPMDIVAMWQSIWQLDPKTFQPNFTTMFEEYTETNEVVIHIAYD